MVLKSPIMRYFFRVYLETDGTYDSVCDSTCISSNTATNMLRIVLFGMESPVWMEALSRKKILAASESVILTCVGIYGSKGYLVYSK